VDLETGWNDRRPPQSLSDVSSRRRRVAAPRPPLLRLAVPSKAPRLATASWVRRSHRVVGPPRGLRPPGANRIPVAYLPWPSAPLQSFTRWSVTPSSGAAGSLEVSFPLDATQPRRATTPGVASSGSCCVPAVPAGLDALLPSRSPRCVSTGRALGVLPSEHDLAGIAHASRRRLPSCDWQVASRSGRTGRPAGRLPVRRARAPSPFGFGAWPGRCTSGLPALRASRILGIPSAFATDSGLGVRNGLAARVSSPCRLGVRHRASTAPASSRLSWVSPSLGPSPSRPWPPGPPHPPFALRRGPPRRPRDRRPGPRLAPAGRDSPVRPPLRYFLEMTLPGSFPCTPEFQRTGKSAGLFRGCQPLRGFPPRPPRVPVARFVRRCRSGRPIPIGPFCKHSDHIVQTCVFQTNSGNTFLS
jgi:hypothetical protein